MLLHCNNDYTNVPQHYVCTYIGCPVSFNSHKSTGTSHEGIQRYSDLTWIMDGGEQSLYHRGRTRYKANCGSGWLSPRTGSETFIDLTEIRTAHHPARSLVTVRTASTPLSLQDTNNYDP